MNKNQYFRDTVRRFYYENKRDFFWRKEDLSPYQIMITELLLKKTKAETVDKFMLDFIRKYDDNSKILAEKVQNLLNQVSRLGLGNQRTRALKKISKYIHESYSDELPCNLDKLMKIPHIGFYIANATMCFGFNRRSMILDVNTSRIISRFFSIDNSKDLRDNLILQQKARELLPMIDFKEYNWGLLDLGALICKPKPLCRKCPLQLKCGYNLERSMENHSTES